MVMPTGSYGMGYSYGMGGYSGNMYEDLKARYGYGPTDFTERPRIAGYPMETVLQGPDRPLEKNWFRKLLQKLYS